MYRTQSAEYKRVLTTLRRTHAESEGSGPCGDGRCGHDGDGWFTGDGAAAFEGLEDFGGDRPGDLAHLVFGIEFGGFGEGLIDGITLRGHSEERDRAACPLGAGRAVDQNRLVFRVEGEAEGGEVFIWIAGGIADEVELVALDAEGLGRELLAAVARVAVRSDAQVDDRFQAGFAGQVLHGGGGKLGTAIDLSGDDFGQAFGPEVGLDGFVRKDRGADGQGTEEADREEGTSGSGAGGRHGVDATP